MIIALSYAPVIEEILVAELISYLEKVRWNEMYPKFPNPRISNEYPWVPYMNEGWPDLSSVSETLFPSVTIVSSSDEESPRDVAVQLSATELTKDEFEAFKVLVSNDAYLISQEAIDEMETYFESKDNLYGVKVCSSIRDHINMDIITDDPTNVRNRLYDLVKLFVKGPERLEVFQSHGIEIMNGTISGSRTPEYNVEFGRVLRGSSITFQADYVIEQTFYNTDIETLAGVEVTHIPHTIGG